MFAFQITCFFELFLTILLYYTNLFSESHTFLPFIIIIAFINLCVISFINLKKHKVFSDHFLQILFLTGYCIVSYQLYIDYLNGKATDNNSIEIFPISILNKSALISTAGLISFLLASTISHEVQENSDTLSMNYKLMSVTPLKTMLLIITGLFLFFNRDMFGSVRYSQETLENRPILAHYSTMFFQIFIFLILSYTSYNIKAKGKQQVSFYYYVKEIGLLFHICFLIYIFSLTFWGDRGPILYLACGYFASYLIVSSFKISYIHFLIIIFIGSALLTQILLFRNTNNDLSFNDRIQQLHVQHEYYSTTNTSLFPLTSELANSIECLHYVVNYIPEKASFAYGAFTLKELVSIIPWANHFIRFIDDDKSFRNTSSAYYCTWLIQGENYTYGNGTCCTADLYLNFGFIGVMIGMFAFGFLIAKVESLIHKKKISIPLYLLYIILCSYSIYISRSTILCYLNYFSFCIIVHIFYSIFISHDRKTYSSRFIPNYQELP